MKKLVAAVLPFLLGMLLHPVQAVGGPVADPALAPIVIDRLPFTFTFQPFPGSPLETPEDPTSCWIGAKSIAVGPHLVCEFVNASGRAVLGLEFSWIAPPDVWNFYPFVDDGGPWFSREDVVWYGATFRDGGIPGGTPPFAVDLAGFRAGMSITMTAVPAPTTSGLLFIGLGAAAADRWRRTRRRPEDRPAKS